MSVTIDGPADFPALYRSADRESERAQRSYLRTLRVRLGALIVAAFGGALTLTTAGGFHVGGGLAFLAFACALGAELYLARTNPLTTWCEGRVARRRDATRVALQCLRLTRPKPGFMPMQQTSAA
jgi:SMODS and SLOG-associating 2TM effector domain 3